MFALIVVIHTKAIVGEVKMITFDLKELIIGLLTLYQFPYKIENGIITVNVRGKTWDFTVPKQIDDDS